MRKSGLYILLLFCFTNIHSRIYGQIITTVAGGGSSLADGVPATSENIGIIVGLAVDSSGNLYIADGGHNKIRKVDAATGIIMTIAGTGTIGCSGDGGPATSALLNSPIWITINDHLNLYMNCANSSIRKIDAITGNITTVAGGIGNFYNGDGIPATAAGMGGQKAMTDRYGNLYISDVGNRRIRKVDTAGIITTIGGTGTVGYSGDGGPATAAKISNCFGLFVDTSGHVYFADDANKRIRMIDQGTGIITTIAGNGIGTYNGDGIQATDAQLEPHDVTLDNFGNIYIADYGNERIRRIDAATGIISTVAGIGTTGFSGDGGMATLAEMNYSAGVAVDLCGNIYIADASNQRVRKVNYSALPITITNTIATSPTDTICTGATVVFDATATASSGAITYQWYVDGSIVSTSGNSYTYTPANGDSIRCVATATNPCTSATASSNTITMVVNPVITPTVTVISTADTVCNGTAVTFMATASAGSVLSYQWLVNGSAIAGATNVMYNYTPANGDSVRCVALATSPCTPATTSSNSIMIVVNPIITPTVTVTSTGGDTVCNGTAVTFSVTATGTSSALHYQWLVNGTAAAGATSTVYSYTPASGDSIRCMAMATSPCTPVTTSSNSMMMVVNPIITPTVTVTSTVDTVCSGTAVTFSVTATGISSALQYQWLVDGIVAAGATNATYSYTPANGDSVRCVATATSPCTPTTTSSNSIMMVVNPIITPTVTITSTGDTVCDGTIVTFSITATGTSGALSYQWLVNGAVAAGATSTTYNYTPANGDSIRCVAMATSPCTPATTSSNSIMMVVNPIITPTVTVTSTADTVCNGTAVTFTITATGISSALHYQWLVDGLAAAGATNATYNYTPANGDSVHCVAMTTSPCSPTTTSSNSIMMVVNPIITPTVTVTSTGDTVCDGTMVAFSVTVTGIGSVLHYQWLVNGATVSGATSTTFNYTPANGDSIRCAATSSSPCTSPMTNSNSIIMVVNSIVAPTINITSTGDTVCNGAAVTFTAATGIPTAINVTYQWLVNSTPITGATNVTYSYVPANADSIRCVLTVVSACSTDTASSNMLIMVADPVFIPIVIITSGGYTHAGESDTVRAVVTGAGGSPSFQWALNGAVLTGETADMLIRNDFVNGDSVSCIATFSGLCGMSSFNSIFIAVEITATPPQPAPGGREVLCTYPNPVTALLYVDNVSVRVAFKIHSAVGSIVQQGMLEQGGNVINVKKLPAGVYIIEVADAEGNRMIRKIVKE